MIPNKVCLFVRPSWSKTMAREELKWQNLDADDLPAQVKKSFDAMVEAEAVFKADLEKLLKAEGHMPEDKFLVMSRKGNIDDAALAALDVVISRLQQLEDDVLDVLADVAGFGERRRIGHGEGHVEDAREGLRQQRLAGPGRTDQQDVRLRELDVVVLCLVVETLVVVMIRDCE